MTGRDALEVPEIADGTCLGPGTLSLAPRRERRGYLRRRRAPALGVALLLYVLAVCGTTTYSYLTARAALIAEIDKDLLVAARAVRYILADDFHDRAQNPQAIAPAEDRRNIEALTAYARDAELAFVFSVIAVDGEAVVTTSSASPEEIAAGTEVLTFTPYPEGNERLARPLASTVPIAETYNDRLGELPGPVGRGTQPRGSALRGGGGDRRPHLSRSPVPDSHPIHPDRSAAPASLDPCLSAD